MMPLAAPDLAMNLDTDPVELIFVGCSAGAAEGFANALRNRGQAVHLKLADGLDGLRQQLAVAPSHLALILVDALGSDTRPAIHAIREANPDAGIILLADIPSANLPLLAEPGVQDLVAFADESHVAHAIQREYQNRLVRDESLRLRRQLDQAEQRSRQLVQSSRDAIAYVHDGIFLQTNPAFLQLFGYESADQVDGLPILDMIDAASRGALKTALRRVEDGEQLSERLRCINADGSPFDVPIELAPAWFDGEHCAQMLIRYQAEQRDLQQRIDELSSRDTLTGFLNRHAFTERLESSIAAQEKGTRPALIHLTISNFIELRREGGFVLGDRLLREVAGELAEVGAGADCIARIGDHDFMLLADAADAPNELAERCERRFADHEFESTGASAMRPAFQVTLTLADAGQEAAGALDLINRACRAQVKGPDRGASGEPAADQAADAAPGQMSDADAAMVRQVERSLETDGFRLKYQPIVSLQGDTRENYAVYLRLIDDQGTELLPSRFLQPAAQAGRLADIDRWVVRNAIREMSSHRRDGRKLAFFVVLSRAAIEDGSMLLWICDCLREFRAKGSWFIFQFSEPDLHGILPAARELIQGLKRINCRIALNQFTDSATALLEELEPDIVKLAPEYVRNLAAEPGKQDRLDRVNKMLQERGVQTVATGVEDASSLAVLWSIRVNYIQGTFLQEPSSDIAPEEQE